MNEKNNVTPTVPPRAPRPTQKPVRNGAAAKPQSADALKAQLNAAQKRNAQASSAPKKVVPQMSAVQKSKVSSAVSNTASKELQSRISAAQSRAKPAQSAAVKNEIKNRQAVSKPVSQTTVKPVTQPVAKPAVNNQKATANVQKPMSAQREPQSKPLPQKQPVPKPTQSAASQTPPVRRPVRPEPERITSPQMQRRRETVGAHVYEEKERVRRNVKKKSGPLKIVVRVLSFLLTFVIIIAATVFVSLKMICGDTSPAAKELLVTTLLETGQMKDIASWFLSAEEIQQIVDGNKMSAFENDIDSSLISIDKTPEANENGAEQKDIEVVEISGRTFFGTLLIIKDPSRVELASTYPWKEEGVPLDKLVNDAGAVAGINGGLYNSTNNSGGKPYGVVVCKGEIQFNEPQQYPGLVLIGFTEDNILEIIPIGDYSKKDIENLVRDKKIRDAVTFQEEASDKNNHFVQLVINGEARDMNGMGSGLNPRTAIGQRSDGSVLMLVTDGRGKAGHLGASASDLINIMVEYGAVNAANLDGGSSSCMYYNGEYLMTSVTFYYSNSSWKLPLGFVVK